MEKLKERIDNLHENYEINREVLNKLNDQYDNSLDKKKRGATCVLHLIGMV